MAWANRQAARERYYRCKPGAVDRQPRHRNRAAFVSIRYRAQDSHEFLAAASNHSARGPVHEPTSKTRLQFRPARLLSIPTSRQSKHRKSKILDLTPYALLPF